VFSAIVHKLPYFPHAKLYSCVITEDNKLIYSGLIYSPHEILKNISNKIFKDVLEYLVTSGYIIDWDSTIIKFDPLREDIFIDMSRLSILGFSRIKNMTISTKLEVYQKAIPDISDVLKIARGLSYVSFASLEDILIYISQGNSNYINIEISNTASTIETKNSREYFSQLKFEKIETDKFSWIKYNDSTIKKELILKVISIINTLIRADVKPNILTISDLLVTSGGYVFNKYELEERIGSSDMFNYIASKIDHIEVFDDELINFMNIKKY